MSAVDLFSGSRGWDVGARAAGLEDALGIDVDEAACATSEAAGFPTLRADVAALDPLDFAPCDRLIGSPPCQARSMAGKRGGERDLQHVFACLRDLAAGKDTRAEHLAQCEDARSMLVVEPLRWALALRPTHIALEQVPPVIEEWRLVASILRAEGYKVWTGILSAERYGVPQTRRRAILIASLDGPVHPPTPTHQRYEPGVPACEQHTLEGVLLPWVSMAEALGWGMTERPTTTVATPHGGGGPTHVLYGGSGAQRTIDRERDAGRWQGIDRPAPTVTAGGGAKGGVEVFARGGREAIATIRTNNFTAKQRDMDGKRSKAGSVPYERPVDEPAPTVDTSVNGWQVTHMAKKEDRPERKAQGAGNQPRPVEAPAATLDTRTDLATWVGERPATTVAGDPRIAQPGHKKDDANPDSPGRMQDAVRVTLQEALILQGFPPDYPVAGSRTKQFEQVGNAIPPPLAHAIQQALIPTAMRKAA